MWKSLDTSTSACLDVNNWWCTALFCRQSHAQQAEYASQTLYLIEISYENHLEFGLYSCATIKYYNIQKSWQLIGFVFLNRVRHSVLVGKAYSTLIMNTAFPSHYILLNAPWIEFPVYFVPILN